MLVPLSMLVWLPHTLPPSARRPPPVMHFVRAAIGACPPCLGACPPCLSAGYCRGGAPPGRGACCCTARDCASLVARQFPPRLHFGSMCRFELLSVLLALFQKGSPRETTPRRSSEPSNPRKCSTKFSSRSQDIPRLSSTSTAKQTPT